MIWCPPSPVTSPFVVCRCFLKKINNKARIVEEGGGVTFFARDYWYNRWDTGWWFFGVNALFQEFHLFVTCNENTSECNEGDTSSSVGKMCKICSKAKWQCCECTRYWEMYRVVMRDSSADPCSNILYIQGTKDQIQGPHIQSFMASSVRSEYRIFR